MVKQSESFRQKLLARESWDSPFREQYERAVDNLLTGKLTSVQRWSLTATALAALGSAVLFVWCAAAVENLPLLIRMFFIEGVAFCMVWIVYAAVVLQRGEFHRRRQPLFVSGLAWILSVVLCVNFLLAAGLRPNSGQSVFFVGLGIAMLVGAGIGLLRTCIEQSELRTRESVLETQYQLANIAERLLAGDERGK